MTELSTFPRLLKSQETIIYIFHIHVRDLRAIPQNTFQDALQNWKKRWERCIKSGGEYFEVDKFD
jgi:hypothetical protein